MTAKGSKVIALKYIKPNAAKVWFVYWKHTNLRQNRINSARYNE